MAFSSLSLESIVAIAITTYLGTVMFYDKEGISLGSVAVTSIAVLAHNLKAGPLAIQVFLWHYILLSQALIN